MINQVSDNPSSQPDREAIPLARLPGPRSLPIIGNYHQINLDRLHIDLENWADQYGPIYRVRFRSSDIAVISDRRAIQQVLVQRPEKFRREQVLESVAKEMHLNGVFVAEGDDWRRQRRLVVAALSRARLSGFFPQLITIVERLKQRWERAAERGRPVNITDDLNRFTVDVTMHIAFGIESNTLATSGPVIQKHLDIIFPKIHQRTNLPFAYWRHFKLPSDRKLESALREIRREADAIIKTTRTRLRARPELRDSPGNFLEALLANAERENSGFTDPEIFANIGTLLLAGEDTTANTIAWAVYSFAKYPEHFARALQEVDQVLAGDNLIRRPEQLEQLPFLDAFRDEVMRLKPVAPVMVMQSNDDVEILGTLIPKGTALMLLTRHMATQDGNFSQPREFQPDRWLKSSSKNFSRHDASAFIPFGAGARFCPGRNLAFLQIRAVLPMLCRNFDIELVNVKGGVRERLAFTMFPDNLFVKLTARRNSTA